MQNQMKRFTAYRAKVAILSCCICCLAISPLWAAESVPEPTNLVKQNPQFDVVAQKLDMGGDFYLFLNTEKCIKRLREHMTFLFQSSGTPPEFRQIGAIATTVFDSLAVASITSFGASAIEVGDLYRTKFYLHAPGERAGLLKILGPAPHALGVLDYAPSDTALLTAGDLDLAAAFDLVRSVLIEAGQGGLSRLFDGFLAQANARLAQASGSENVDVEALVKTLGTEIGVLVGLDAHTTITLPLGARGEATGGYPFSAPRFAVMVRTRDASLYELIVKILQTRKPVPVVDISVGDVRKLLIQTPPFPPFPIAPVLVCDGEFTIFCSHLQFLEQMLQTKRGEAPRLDAEADFKRLSAGLPRENNGLEYLSPRLGEEAGKFAAWLQTQTASGQVGGARLPTILNMLQIAQSEIGGMAAIRTNEKDGILVVSQRAKTEPSALMSASAGAIAAPVAILSAIAIPNFLEAQTRAKVARARADMRTLATAMEAYCIDNSTYPPQGSGADGINAPLGSECPAYGISTFGFVRSPDGVSRLLPLTTPIAYLTRYPEDLFAGGKNVHYGYCLIDKSKWLLFSPGPDQKYDIVDPIKELESSAQTLEEFLLKKTYDPTNGTKSAGDLLRVSSQ